jgi:hypothetical protein
MKRVYLCLLIIAAPLAFANFALEADICFASKDSGRAEHYEDGEDHAESKHAAKRGHGRERKYPGAEEAGDVSIVLLTAANLTALISLTRRLIVRHSKNKQLPVKQIIKIDVAQKKLLLPLHYHGNLAALPLIAWHWLGMNCQDTILPEIGAAAMVLLSLLGVAVKFGLLKAAAGKAARTAHMHPAAALGIALALAAGHMIVD